MAKNIHQHDVQKTETKQQYKQKKGIIRRDYNGIRFVKRDDPIFESLNQRKNAGSILSIIDKHQQLIIKKVFKLKQIGEGPILNHNKFTSIKKSNQSKNSTFFSYSTKKYVEINLTSPIKHFENSQEKYSDQKLKKFIQKPEINISNQTIIKQIKLESPRNSELFSGEKSQSNTSRSRLKQYRQNSSQSQTRQENESLNQNDVQIKTQNIYNKILQQNKIIPIKQSELKTPKKVRKFEEDPSQRKSPVEKTAFNIFKLAKLKNEFSPSYKLRLSQSKNREQTIVLSQVKQYNNVTDAPLNSSSEYENKLIQFSGRQKRKISNIKNTKNKIQTQDQILNSDVECKINDQNLITSNQSENIQIFPPVNIQNIKPTFLKGNNLNTNEPVKNLVNQFNNYNSENDQKPRSNLLNNENHSPNAYQTENENMIKKTKNFQYLQPTELKHYSIKNFNQQIQNFDQCFEQLTGKKKQNKIEDTKEKESDGIFQVNGTNISIISKQSSNVFQKSIKVELEELEQYHYLQNKYRNLQSPLRIQKKSPKRK